MAIHEFQELLSGEVSFSTAILVRKLERWHSGFLRYGLEAWIVLSRMLLVSYGFALLRWSNEPTLDYWINSFRAVGKINPSPLALLKTDGCWLANVGASAWPGLAHPSAEKPDCFLFQKNAAA